jgi:NADH-quinone oxidoreductase subunit M
VGQRREVGRKVYASFKFMIYTMAGSLGLLLAIQMIGVVFKTFDLPDIIGRWMALAIDRRILLGFRFTTDRDGQSRLPSGLSWWPLPSKVPCLAIPHLAAGRPHRGADCRLDDPGRCAAQAGRLRLPAFVLPLYPEQAQAVCHTAGGLATAGDRLRRIGRLRAGDFKRLVAYSSVNHMGFVVLGSPPRPCEMHEPPQIAMNGAVLQMFNHGLSAAGMFFLVGVIYDRTTPATWTRWAGTSRWCRSMAAC